MTATKTPAAASAAIRAKFAQARDEMTNRMIDRNDEIDVCLTALAAGEHCLFVGPPGTGKSMMADGIVEFVHGIKFSYLMTKFTDPMEILGPPDLSALKNGEYVRVTKGKLPEANVAFLDEIFKASSAILNTGLRILNERKFNDGRGDKDVPLQLCIAASNEWPTGDGQQELGALFDRFVIRRTVKPISSAAGLKKLRFGQGKVKPLTVSITPAELDQVRDEVESMEWSEAAMEAFDKIVAELHKEGIFPGDRRQRKAVKVAAASAWIEGATQVLPEHLAILSDVLWDSPEEQPQKCKAIVAKLANPAAFVVNSLMVEVEQIIGATDIKKMTDVAKAAKKLSEIHGKLIAMKGNPKADKAIAYVTDRSRAMKQAAMDTIS